MALRLNEIIAEFDVTRFHIGQIHAELGKRPLDRLDFLQTLAELFRLFFHPIRHHFGWVIRLLIQIGSGEIQDEWRRNNRHLDNPEVVVKTDQSWNLEFQNLLDLPRLQSQIDIEFALKQPLVLKDLIADWRSVANTVPSQPNPNRCPISI